VFQGGIFAVDGQLVQAQQARLQLQAATQSKSGVLGATDLQIRQLTNAANFVRAMPGGYVALGVEEPQQGSYTEHNVGEDATIEIPGNSTATDRYDMVVVRVEDPTLQGSPWAHDPATDPLSYFRVISNVGPNATQMPAGQTGAPLARVRVKANTATPAITTADITDLRVVANPKTSETLKVLNLPNNKVAEVLLGSGFSVWPDEAQWTVDIPPWAVRCSIMAEMGGAQAEASGTNGGNWVGQVRVQHGEMVTEPTEVNLSASRTGRDTTTFIVGDDLPVPRDHRGTTRGLSFRGQLTTASSMELRAAHGTNVRIRVVYFEDRDDYVVA